MSIREMGGMRFTPLTDEDRKHNAYLDNINHAPYFTIFLVIGGTFCLFTMAMVLAAF